jgi:acetylornithine deacetylase/succinyl-diaminopimelate desuccinylase-like protein
MATDTLELAKALVAIDSVNPSLVAGGAGEREIAAFVIEWARSQDVWRSPTAREHSPPRPPVTPPPPSA